MGPLRTHGASEAEDEVRRATPEITHCSFGALIVDGARYNEDVIVTPEGVQKNWWRVECHLLTPCDLDDILSRSPSLLVIGTGCDGLMTVPESTLAFLTIHHIDYELHATPHACVVYNQQRLRRRTFALLHLTC